jgi:2-oxoglutarate dehydrogenase E2 component (dihydrolipoamide succinyltransferase)
MRAILAALVAGLLLGLAPVAFGDPDGKPHEGSNGKGRDKTTTTETTPAPAPAPAPAQAPAPAPAPAAPAPEAPPRTPAEPRTSGGARQSPSGPRRSRRTAPPPARARTVAPPALRRDTGRRAAPSRRTRARTRAARQESRAARPRDEAVARSAPSRTPRPEPAGAPAGVLGATVRCCDDEPALTRLLAETSSPAAGGSGGTPGWLVGLLAAAILLAALTLQRAYATRR